MPISARVVRWAGVATTITDIEMAAEASCSACCHGSERAPLFGSVHGVSRKPMTMPTCNISDVKLWSMRAPRMEL
jgi:hypothetical protein